MKRTGCANMTGEYYEVKLVALLFLRAVQSRQEFHIASNMKAAGNFDDVVLSLGKHSIFLQLKHKENSKKLIHMTQLTYDKNFKLSKYLKSYLDIKCQWEQDEDLQNFGRFEDSLFVVYTNVGIDDCLVNNVGNAELLSLVNAGGKYVSLAELFQNLPKYKDAFTGSVNCKHSTDTLPLLCCKRNENNIRELVSDLEDLGDFSEFLSQFYFCVKEATQEQLDDYIRKEMYALCGTDVMFEKLIAAVQKWWKNSNFYLTESAQFWQDILQESVANIVKRDSKLNVKFDENCLKPIRELLSLESRILFLKTSCIDLTRLKVLESLEIDFAVDGSILDARLNEVLALWKLGACGEILLLELGSVDRKMLLEFANLLKSCPRKKLVIVSDEHDSLIVELFRPLKVILFTDSLSLKQFDSGSQIQLLNTKVIFQGVSVKLMSLGDCVANAITEEPLMKLLITNIQLEVGDEINDLDYYYISRTFQRSEFVNEGIFKNGDVRFAVTGISRRELKRLVPSEVEVVNFDQNSSSKDERLRHFIISSHKDFVHLCRSYENIHWIHKSSRGFIWKQSKGNMTAVERHLLEHKTSYSVKDILKLPQQIVLIVAKPGMGKSTELSHICCVLKKNDPSVWIVRVDLSKYMPYLNQEKISAMDLLQKAGKFETQFERALFEHQVNNGGNVAVLFDGFDEMSPHYSRKVIKLLKDLLDTKIKKVFVTSRPVKRKELEHEFSVISFSLLPFTRYDQKDFLLKFWNVPEDCPYDVTQFILALLDLSRKSVIDIFSIGIPLETLLLASIFHNDALHYCRTGENRLPHNLYIIELYSKFIDKKFEVYYKRIGIDVSNELSVPSRRILKSEMEDNLIACALLVTLADEDINKLSDEKDVLKRNKKCIEEFETVSQRMGIITEIVNNKAVFVHQTFAEYFAGLWLSKRLVSKLNIDVYKNENYQIIRSFCDRFLAEGCKLHLAVLEKGFLRIRTLLCGRRVDVNSVDRGGRTALHLSAMYFDEFGNHSDKEFKINIAKILLEFGADINIEDNILCMKPLQLAQEVQALGFIELLLLEKKIDKKELTLFRDLCAKVSLKDTFTIARNRGFKRTFVNFLKGNRFESLNGILKHLIENGYINLLAYFMEHGVKPDQILDDGISLLGFAVCLQHLEIAKLLIKERAGVNTTFNDGKTPLLLAIKNEQREMVQLLLESGAKVEKRDKYKQTPLMRAVKRNSLDIADLLLKHGASANAKNYFGGTALTIATRHGQKEMVQLLLRSGADIEAKSGYYEDTPLLVATKKANVQVVELLVKGRINSTTRSDDGETPFLFIRENYRRGMSDNVSHRSPLLRAVTEESLNLVEMLIKHGADVNARDRFGDTALTIATGNGQKAIVELLLRSGADFEKRSGCYEETPLMKVVRTNHVEIAKTLIEHGASVNATNAQGDSALVIAMHCQKREMVQLLLQGGAETDITSGSGEATPLMKAIETSNAEIIELLNRASVNATNEKFEP